MPIEKIAGPSIPPCACLRLFPALGLMDRYHLYPATAKDPAIFYPRWPAAAVFLMLLLMMLVGARRLYTRFFMPPDFGARRSVAYAALALCSLYLMIRNPFSLLFMVPALAWLWIRERTGLGRILNGLALFTGGLVIYALLYFFGFVILRNDFAVLWYIQIKSGRPATQTLHRDR